MTQLHPAPYTERITPDTAIREYRLPAGMEIETDAHEYDHLSQLHYGSVLLVSGDERRVLVGPCMVEIKAGIRHRVHILTETAWDCIRSLEQAKLEGLA